MQEVLDRQRPRRDNPKSQSPKLDRAPDATALDIASTREGDSRLAPVPAAPDNGDTASRVIEGVFDGLRMIGPDGKAYSIPTNYASKSKLVEGDVMKLTIAPDGTFIYKLIAPIERERMVGVLTRDDETEQYRVLANGREYRVLFASVSYFKGEAGDECVILVPGGGQSLWAALENIIKEQSGSPEGISALMARSASESIEPEQKRAASPQVAPTSDVAVSTTPGEASPSAPSREESARLEVEQGSTVEELEDIEEF